MRFLVKMLDADYVLTAAQMDQLMELVSSAEIREEEHVGENNGSVGWKNSYIPVLKQGRSSAPKVEVMSSTEYQALVAITNMRAAAKEN